MSRRDVYGNLDAVLTQAPGPSPWYLLAGGPRLTSRHGQLGWAEVARDAPHTDPRSGKVLLITPGGEALAIFDFYCHVQPVAGAWFLVWFEQKPALFASELPPASVRLMILDADQLEPIEEIEAACARLGRRRDRCRMYYQSREVSAFSVPSHLPVGTNSVMVPEEFRAIPEILMLARSSAIQTCGSGMGLALFVLSPGNGTVELIPQDWFNQGRFDFGYQWPTRVARDPATGRIVGEGFRLGRFVLDQSGRQIDRWLQPDPAYHPERQV